jgi:hypothetical protein
MEEANVVINHPDIILTKICAQCKIDLLLIDFHRNSHSKDGLQSTCKFCRTRYVNNTKYIYKKPGYKCDFVAVKGKNNGLRCNKSCTEIWNDKYGNPHPRCFNHKRDN